MHCIYNEYRLWPDSKTEGSKLMKHRGTKEKSVYYYIGSMTSFRVDFNAEFLRDSTAQFRSRKCGVQHPAAAGAWLLSLAS